MGSTLRDKKFGVKFEVKTGASSLVYFLVDVGRLGQSPSLHVRLTPVFTSNFTPNFCPLIWTPL